VYAVLPMEWRVIDLTLRGVTTRRDYISGFVIVARQQVAAARQLLHRKRHGAAGLDQRDALPAAAGQQRAVYSPERPSKPPSATKRVSSSSHAPRMAAIRSSRRGTGGGGAPTASCRRRLQHRLQADGRRHVGHVQPHAHGDAKEAIRVCAAAQHAAQMLASGVDVVRPLEAHTQDAPPHRNSPQTPHLRAHSRHRRRTTVSNMTCARLAGHFFATVQILTHAETQYARVRKACFSSTKPTTGPDSSRVQLARQRLVHAVALPGAVRSKLESDAPLDSPPRSSSGMLSNNARPRSDSGTRT